MNQHKEIVITNEIIDRIAEDFLGTFPVVRKLLWEGSKPMSVEITPHHITILKVIGETGPMPVSEIGRCHGISKSQMTYLVDRLVELGLVERQPDTNDRRVINIALTGKGEDVLNEFRALIIESIKQKLSSLDESELEQLSDLLCQIRGILAKV